MDARPRSRSLPDVFWLLQLAADAGAVVLAFMLGYLTYRALGQLKDPRPLAFYLRVAGVAAAIVTLIYERLGLYRPQVSVLHIHEFRGVTRGVLAGALTFLALSFYYRDPDGHELSRLVVTLAFGWLLLLANMGRALQHKLQEALFTRGLGCRRVLIYGAGPTGRHLLRRLSGSPQLGFLPVGFLDDRRDKQGLELQGQTGKDYTRVKVLGRLADLAAVAREQPFDEVFVAWGGSSRRARRVFAACDAAGVPYRFVPHLHGVLFQELTIDTLDGIPLARRRAFEPSPVYELVKRAFDVLFAGAVLAALAPLFAVVAWLIKRDSEGPALFVQERVGKNGRPFEMYKFRSMYVSTPAYAYHPKSGEDPRLTPVGRWLRRLSIDELPQFVNVLLGHMSVVGPRPEMRFIVEKYGELERARLRVKPGITGLWQISADRSKMIHENMDYDLFYVYNRGILLDLIIVMETCFTVVRGVGAH